MPAALPLRSLSTRASALRAAIEEQLEQRIPSALSPAPRLYADYLSTGVPVLDDAFAGLPLGAITEVCGQPGSARTALAAAAVAAVANAGHVAAWVDVTDAFDPASGAAAGIPLQRLLWVRCGHREEQKRVAITASNTFQPPHTTRVQHGGGSPHPRSEERGLPEAVQGLLTTPSPHRRDRVIGTPGAPNRNLAPLKVPPHKLSARIEQAGTDRHPPRRGEYVLAQRELFPCALPRKRTSFTPEPGPQEKPWKRIEQALRVTDLLLQTGGFRLIVLDLADVAPQFVSRIPMATWFRFRAGAEQASTSLLAVTTHLSTGSSAALVLRTQASPENGTPAATYCAALDSTVEVARQRFVTPQTTAVPIRKPPRRVSALEWQARSAWSGREDTAQ